MLAAQHALCGALMHAFLPVFHLLQAECSRSMHAAWHGAGLQRHIATHKGKMQLSLELGHAKGGRCAKHRTELQTCVQ